MPEPTIPAAVPGTELIKIKLEIEPDNRADYRGDAAVGIVLIVDDDDLVRDTYDIVLRHGGWTTILAASAEAALDCLQHTHGVSVMVTDLSMPGALDGGDLIELVRAGYPTIGIVLTTGRPVTPGAFGDNVPVLLKPFRVEQLLEAALSVRRSDLAG